MACPLPRPCDGFHSRRTLQTDDAPKRRLSWLLAQDKMAWQVFSSRHEPTQGAAVVRSQVCRKVAGPLRSSWRYCVVITFVAICVVFTCHRSSVYPALIWPDDRGCGCFPVIDHDSTAPFNKPHTKRKGQTCGGWISLRRRR